MPRLTASVLGAAALVGALAGCGDPGASSLPEFSGTAAPATTAAPSATASPTASATSSSGVFADSIEVTAGTVRARGDAKAAATVWIRYWRERTLAYHDLVDDRPALAAVASGDALEQVRNGVAQLRSRRQHTVGSAVVNVSEVAVSGATATITSCLDNRTIDVDSALRPVEAPTARYGLRGVAVKAGAGWKITKLSITSRGTC